MGRGHAGSAVGAVERRLAGDEAGRGRWL